MPEIKPRALIIDLLGDYVRHRGGEIRLKALVAWVTNSASPDRRCG
jgi:DNA-binding transcriptional regulator PaaX